ncbi:MAG: 50S ribosomal protein L21 [Nitriliruptorales bacterium]|nr:50S ribosomal protein L21 [Nitriliruptorales bacterium]
MYAVVAAGGAQQRVEAGQQITVDRVAGEPGDAVELPAVLVVDDQGAVTTGPDLDGRTVTATIVEHTLGPKIRVFTYKNKSRQRKTRGHRSRLTVLNIEKI